MNPNARRRLGIAGSAAWLLALADGAFAQTYSPVLIPLLPGATRSAALGVNDDGDVVGWCFTAPNSYRAFHYERATHTTTEIGALGGSAALLEVGAHSINDDGEVVGVFNSGGFIRAFYWSQTSGFTNISFFPASNPPYHSGALSIGNNGHIGGLNSFPCASSPTLSINAGALWSDSTSTPVSVFGTPFPCGVAGLVHGVNASGASCGENIATANSATWTRPIVLGVGGSATFLPTFSGPAEHGGAFDVSDNGWVCGFAENRSTSPNTSTACIWAPNGQITNLGGAPFGRALAVNDSLHVVGWTSGVSSKQGAIWRNIVPGQSQTNGIDLNTLLSTPIPGGLIITSAEDISETGFIAVRLNETTASARAALLIPAAPTTYCTPNVSGTTNGCQATISASSNPSVSQLVPCTISIASVEGQKTGILFYGVSGAMLQPWCSGGNSFLCVKSPTQRSDAQDSGGVAGQCDGAFSLDWDAFQSANPTAVGQPWAAGDKLHLQGWFRDPPACKTTFLSQALELTYVP